MHLVSSIKNLCMLTCEKLDTNPPNLPATTNSPLWLWLTLEMLELPPFPLTPDQTKFCLLSYSAPNPTKSCLADPTEFCSPPTPAESCPADPTKLWLLPPPTHTHANANHLQCPHEIIEDLTWMHIKKDLDPADTQRKLQFRLEQAGTKEKRAHCQSPPGRSN